MPQQQVIADLDTIYQRTVIEGRHYTAYAAMVAKIIYRGSGQSGMGVELFALMVFTCLMRTGVKLDDLVSRYNLPALCEGLTLRLFCEMPGSPYD